MKDLVHPVYADIKGILQQWSPDEYYKYIFQFTPEMFATRIEMAGFTGAERVLDAGSGYGQWALAMARQNGHVSGIDYTPGMVRISQMLAEKQGVRNVDFRQGDLNQPLPFGDEEFDLVWCWGVIMFVNPDMALREFHRVLKPGGRVLLGCVNSTGRWLSKLLASLNPLRPNRATSRICWKALRHGRDLGAMPGYLTLQRAEAFYQRYGFELQEADLDGRIDVSGAGRRLPMFKPRFLLLQNNIELIGRKAQPARAMRIAA